MFRKFFLVAATITVFMNAKRYQNEYGSIIGSPDMNGSNAGANRLDVATENHLLQMYGHNSKKSDAMSQITYNNFRGIIN